MEAGSTLSQLLGFGLLLWIGFALAVFGLPAAFLAGQRGRSPVTWAAIAVFIGPFAIITAGLSTRAPDGRFYACPHCDEAISLYAARCPFCSSEL